jgi:hypothetical protein
MLAGVFLETPSSHPGRPPPAGVHRRETGSSASPTRCLRVRFQDIVFGAGIPLMQVVRAANLRPQHLFGAPEARTHGRVHRAAPGRNSEPRRRQDRILFGVHPDAQIVRLARFAGLVPVRAAIASAIQAVHHVLWSAVVPGLRVPHPCRGLCDRACPERSRRGGDFDLLCATRKVVAS